MGGLWRNGREAAFDIGLWLVLLVLGPFLSLLYPATVPVESYDWLGGFGVSFTLATVAGAGLIVRRRFPLALVVLATAVAIAQAVLVATGQGLLFPVNLATDPRLMWETAWIIYAFAVYAAGSRRRIVGWVLIALLTVVAMRPWEPVTGQLVLSSLAVTVFPAVLGLYVGARRRLVRMLRDRVDRAESEQHLLAEQARADERARLAVEMHDVVTHRVSLMVLRAGALGVTARDEATREAAEDLRASGCQALEELRDLVGVLRTESASDRSPDDSSASSILDLSALVDESESVGMRVGLVTEGDSSLVSPAVGRTAHRVVQEALTNVRKHAWGSEVHLNVRYSGDRVRLTVRNTPPPDTDATGLAESGSGTGLRGLRERVELVGGDFHTAALDDGGFELDVILPAYVPTDERVPGE